MEHIPNDSDLSFSASVFEPLSCTFSPRDKYMPRDEKKQDDAVQCSHGKKRRTRAKQRYSKKPKLFGFEAQSVDIKKQAEISQRNYVLEEGEIEYPKLKSKRSKICRFYNRGYCALENSCKFLHMKKTATGNNTMFSARNLTSRAVGIPQNPNIENLPTSNHKKTHFQSPREITNISSEALQSPQGSSEFAWERGIRHGKELKKRHNREEKPKSDLEEGAYLGTHETYAVHPLHTSSRKFSQVGTSRLEVNACHAYDKWNSSSGHESSEAKEHRRLPSHRNSQMRLKSCNLRNKNTGHKENQELTRFSTASPLVLQRHTQNEKIKFSEDSKVTGLLNASSSSAKLITSPKKQTPSEGVVKRPTCSRKEELLRQMKAVEDAVARNKDLMK